MYTCYIYVCARTYYVEWLGLRANSAFKCNGWTQMKLEYIGIGIRCIHMYWNILYLCVDWHLDHMCAFGICIEMLLLGNFHGGLYSHEITYFRGGVLSRNLFHEGDSHEIYFRGWLPRNTNSHEIISWRWPLMKYHKKPSWKHWCKSGGNAVFMRVTVTNPPRKIICGGELSWKWYFRVSIIVGGELSWKWYFCVSIIVRVKCVTVYPHALFSWE
jgi:hypothetical protein